MKQVLIGQKSNILCNQSIMLWLPCLDMGADNILNLSPERTFSGEVFLYHKSNAGSQKMNSIFWHNKNDLVNIKKFWEAEH